MPQNNNVTYRDETQGDTKQEIYVDNKQKLLELWTEVEWIWHPIN